MGYRPQQPQGGYGQQPELRPGATVVSADGAWRGTVVDLAGQGADAAVRVQWDGYGLTYVTMGMLVHDNGRWMVRSEGQAQGGGAAQTGQQAQQGQGAQAAQPGQQGQAAQGGYGAQAAGRDPRAAASGEDMTMMAGAAPQPRPQQPQPQPQAGAQAGRIAAPQPVAGDEMTRMPQAAPRPASQPQPQPAQSQMGAQAARPAPNPYYPQPSSAPMQEREQAIVEVGGEERVVVPLIEERLEAHPEWRDAGNVRLNVRTEEVPRSVTQDVQREEVLVERVAVGRPLAEGEDVSPRQEGDVYVVPVIVEEVVVLTRRILAEEVRLTKRIVTVPQTVETTLRQQRVEVDGGVLSDRVHDERDDNN